MVARLWGWLTVAKVSDGSKRTARVEFVLLGEEMLLGLDKKLLFLLESSQDPFLSRVISLVRRSIVFFDFSYEMVLADLLSFRIVFDVSNLLSEFSNFVLQVIEVKFIFFVLV